MVSQDWDTHMNSAIYTPYNYMYLKNEKVILQINHHVICVQNGIAVGSVSSATQKNFPKGVFVNKKCFPKLKTKLFSNNVSAQFYFIPMEQRIPLYITTKAKFKTGETVEINFNTLIWLYLEDAQKWYNTFIKAIKAQNRKGVIYTRESFSDIIKSVLTTKIQEIIAQNNRPSSVLGKITVDSKIAKTGKQPEASLYDLVKKSMTNELKAVGFRSNIV